MSGRTLKQKSLESISLLPRERLQNNENKTNKPNNLKVLLDSVISNNRDPLVKSYKMTRVKICRAPV